MGVYDFFLHYFKSVWPEMWSPSASSFLDQTLHLFLLLWFLKYAVTYIDTHLNYQCSLYTHLKGTIPPSRQGCGRMWKQSVIQDIVR